MNEAIVRDGAAALWLETDGGVLPIADRLSRWFAARREIAIEDKGEIVRRFYRMVKWKRWCAFALETVAAYESAELRATAIHDLIVAKSRVDRHADAAAAAGAVFDDDADRWMQVVRETARRAAAITDPIVRFGIQHSLPDVLAAVLIDELGGEAARFAEAINDDSPITLRANSLLTTREELLEKLESEGIDVRPTQFSRLGIRVDSAVNVFRLDAFENGLFDLQDEASQLAAEVVAPPPGGRIADLCAGAGGKTLAIAAAMAGKGRILALDTSKRRLEELRRRARRARTHQIVVEESADDEWSERANEFISSAHRLLLDVPCSGLGSLRRHCDMRWRIDAEHLARLPRVQATLLDRALALLRPGARVIYATCTVRRQENEDIVEKALAAHPEIERVRVAEILGNARARDITDTTGTSLVLLPHVHGTDGFFAAVLRRRE